MKNKFIVYGILSVLSFVGCDKEDDLSWNGDRTNWFEIQDKPGRFNQLAYQVYRESGLPIFVNDTIGTEIRGTDAYGEPIIHHEMFVVGYSITSQLGEAGFVLSSDTANMLKAVELIRDRVIPNLPAKLLYRPYSIFLVDTLYSIDYDWKADPKSWPDNMQTAYSYRSMMGVVAGRLFEISRMNEDEQAFWAGMIVAENVAPALMAYYNDDIQDFYKVTKDAGGDYRTMYRGFASTGAPIDPNFSKECEELGFFEWKNVGRYKPAPTLFVQKTTISDALDVKEYVAAVYAYTQQKFEELYADYPFCIKKYEIMKGIVERFKQEIDK